MCNVVSPTLDLPALQAAFVTLIQPRLVRHARIHLDEWCAETKADKIAEVVALAWKWFLRLAERGKDARHFPMVLADFAVRAVKNGRRVTGMERTKDVMSERAQQRHGFKVEPFPASTRLPHEGRCSDVGGQQRHDAFEERFRDNTQTPVPDQVVFRLDFPAWRKTRTQRDQRIIDAMAMGERTKDLSRKFGISPARISQLRRECHADWTRFCGEGIDEPEEAAIAAV